MRLVDISKLAIVSALLSCGPALADPEPLPDSGTYFIINSANDQALQPAGGTLGQNVLLYDFNKGGLQKWVLTRKLDPKTNKPTNRYTIRLAGENSELNLQPHPMADCTAIIGDEKATYVIEPGDPGVTIKSVARNGDAMYMLTQPPMNAELHFGPSDGSSKFRWKFVSVN